MARLWGIGFVLVAMILPRAPASPDLGAAASLGQHHDRSLIAPAASTATAQADPLACDAFGQRNVLLLFYNITNGPNWVNQTGWPSLPGLSSMSPGALIAHMASVAVTTNACMASDGSGIELPDHCW